MPLELLSTVLSLVVHTRAGLLRGGDAERGGEVGEKEPWGQRDPSITSPFRETLLLREVAEGPVRPGPRLAWPLAGPCRACVTTAPPAS